jgi:hypothetical protein
MDVKEYKRRQEYTRGCEKIREDTRGHKRIMMHGA